MNDNQQDQRDPKDPGNNGGKMRQPFFIFLILSLVALFITSLIYSGWATAVPRRLLIPSSWNWSMRISRGRGFDGIVFRLR